MQWNARLLGLEGRVDGEMVVAADVWREPPRPPFEINVPYIKPLHAWEERPNATVPYDVVVYRYEQQVEDGTLIYRRVTPPFPASAVRA